jgi:protein-S-isoprenylcysteine O-methyltransferase Ste14
VKEWKLSSKILIVTVLILSQYILTFFVFNLSSLKFLQWLGWGVWLISIYFGFAPIFILQRRGGVAQGDRYVQTTRLVDTNLYAIVRHPQFVAGMLFSFALMLLSTHWLVIVLGLVCMVLLYLDICEADLDGIEKFGEEYQAYMQRVPRANFILGLIKYLSDKS